VKYRGVYVFESTTIRVRFRKLPRLINRPAINLPPLSLRNLFVAYSARVPPVESRIFNESQVQGDRSLLQKEQRIY